MVTIIVGGCSADNKINTEKESVNMNENLKDTANDKWTIGFGSEEIIPEGYDADSDSFSSKYYLAGYRTGNEAIGMLDPQFARAAYISDGNGSNIIICAVDCIGLARIDIEKIRSGLGDLINDYKISDIHIASTHTHAGADTLGLWGPVGFDGKDAGFMEKLTQQTQNAIRNAAANARNGDLYFGSADTEGMQRDSRPPNVFDPLIYRLRFVPDDGSNGLQIINYGAHPEALRSENSKISSDYPCYLGRYIKEQTGDDFIFFAGALGGLISTHRQKDSAGNEYPVEKNVVVTGEILAKNVLSISNETKIEPSIKSKTKVFKIDLNNQLYITMSFLGNLSAKPVEGGGDYNLAMETEATLIKFGSEENNVTIAMIPGEIFPELVLGGNAGEIAANSGVQNPETLSDIIGEKNLLIFGLCNDEIGYIVSPDDYFLHESNPYLEEGKDKFGRGHYEETNSVSINAAYDIATVFSELTEALKN